MIKAWSLQNDLYNFVAISLIVRIYIYIYACIPLICSCWEWNWYNTMTKFKQNQNDIYELNLKIHDETKSTITFRVYFLYHSGQ